MLRAPRACGYFSAAPSAPGGELTWCYTRSALLFPSERSGVPQPVANASYGASNQLTQFGSESSINYTYDVGNRLTQAADSITGTITRNYDGLDRLISETTSQGSINYSYDAIGRLVMMQVAGHPQVNYKYDDANRRTQIAQGNSTVSFSYDASGRRTSLTLPNGVTVSYGYNVASELASINYQLGGSLLGNLTYTYDLAGRRTSVGGSFARTRLPAALANASYNVGNQLTQFGTSNLTYDANGNLTSDGVNTYAWDARNRLIGITGGASVAFQYDPFGRRKRKTVNGTTTEFLYDGMNVVQEFSAGTPVASLLSASLDEPLLRTDPSNTSSYLADALGSTVALYDSNGNSVAQYTYEPFGNTAVTGSSANSFQYTSRESDGTGLYYFRTRYYNPVLQRFISEDPLGFLAGANKYAYVLDSPVNARDPDGTFISHHHRDITVTSAEAAGYSPEEAQALAQQVVDVDFLPGSQGADAAAANIHSMAGRKNGNGPFQKCQQAYDATANQIAQDLQAGTRDGLAKALHAIQDAYSPAHGFKPWDGGATIVAPTVVGPVVIADHVPGVSHIYQDTFPGKAALDAATLASTELLDDLRDNPPGALNPRNYLPGSACGSQ